MGTSLADDDSDDHAVDAEDTGHDDRDERLHDDCGSPDRDGADAGSCLGGSIGCTEVWVRDALLARTRARLTPMKPKNPAPPFSGTGTMVDMLIWILD